MSGISNSLAPLAEEKKTPLLAIVNTDPNVGRNEWSYRYFPSAADEIKPAIKIINKLNSKKLGVIYLNDDFGNSILKELKSGYNGEIFYEYFSNDIGNFRTQLLKLKEKNPDVIYIAGFASHNINIFKQIKELGINSTLFSTTISSLPDTIKSAGDYENGVYVSSTIVYNETEKIKYIHKKYNEKYPKITFDHMSANGYDSIYLIKFIIENNGESNEEIKNGFTKLKDNDFTGILGSITKNNHNINFPIKMAVIENGKVNYLE